VSSSRVRRRSAALAVTALLVGVVSGCAAGPDDAGAAALPARQSTGATHTHQPGTAPHSHGSASGAAAESPDARVASLTLRPGERRVTLRLPGGPYRPSAPGVGRDDYRCFLIDPGLAKDAYVTGSDVLPGNTAVVHHAILFAVPPDQVATAERQDAEAPGDGWSCFGGSALQQSGDDPVRSLDQAPWLAAWAPGGGETVMRRGTGRWMPAGSRVVLQLHYNLRAVEGTDAASFADDTAVKLRLMPGRADLRPLQTMLLVAPVELPCTPDETGPLCDRSQALLDLAQRTGQSAGRTVAELALLCTRPDNPVRPGATQSCDRTVPEDMVVRAVAGHMHLLGRSISVDLDPGTAQETRLLNRKVWDFDDQAATPLPRPVRVRAGETLRVTCTHDAALRSMLPELENEPPRYVTWGEGTSDEMCLGIVQYTRG
jgi:hypothetical protein